MTSKKVWAGLAAAFSVLYLLNPGVGFIEIVPDNLPIIGNLDEATITTLLLWAISVLRGKDVFHAKSDPVEKAKPAQRVDPVE